MSLNTQLLADLVEFAPDAMLIVDGSGTVLYANQRVTDLFGCRREEIVNQSVDLLLPERFRARHASHRRHFSEDRRTRPMGVGLDLLGRRWDGTEFPVEISLSPLRDGLAAAAIRDVTDRKRVEHELIQAREIADTARDEADRANLSKSRFLATASHDLRQPLQALSMLHGTLRRMDAVPAFQEALSQQGLAIDAMKRLLNALLDISKLESGAVKPQPCVFPLKKLFEQLRTEFVAAADVKGLTLEVEDTTIFTRTDPALVEQLLRNLLSNAIKYTRTGLVELRARATSTGVRVEVRDTGVGIPEDQLNLIFEEFFQVGVARNTTREGYGLGLAIVQRIAKLLGFRVDVKSQLGKGSTFALELPQTSENVTTGRAETCDSSTQASKPMQSGKILVTEDEPAVLRATRLLLELEGYQVIPTANREEALERAREHPNIDLLVSDYHLKEDQTGLDVICTVREVLTRNIPAILVTGDTSTAIRRLPRDAGLRLASKPIDADELLNLIHELLDRQAAG
jgi:two-component system, sensor histidine kinase